MPFIPMSLVRTAATLVAAAMSVFHLWVAFVGPPNAYVMRGAHLAFALSKGQTVSPRRFCPIPFSPYPI